MVCFLIMKKKEKTDWFIKGFSILEKEGFSKITIEHLCSLMEVTKGSFYHHFKNMDRYIEALMEYWVEENTLSFIRKVEKLKEIPEKRKLLNELAVQASHKSEQMIRAWSYSQPTVKKYVEQVDKSRLRYLVKLGKQDGMENSKAKYYAMLEYATLIGIQQLFPDLSKTELDQLQKIYNH